MAYKKGTLFGKPRGDVVKHPGALRATAKRMGLVHGDANLSQTVLGKLANSKDPTTRKRAALAETFRHMHHGG